MDCKSSETQVTQNKRLVMNTILLYFRMIITVLIGLYTSRVILQTLGVSDYGIYNLVGGIVSMLSFLNSGMVAATQRFLSYDLGVNDKGRLSITFSTSVSIHAIIAIIIVILLETIGLWYVNAKLNIEPDRIIAANWSYQSAIFAFAFSVISWPYNAAIVAHEHMSAFAYISIFEVILKLVIVFALVYIPFDKLIVYSVLTIFVTVIIRFTYLLYCRKHFTECRYKFILDKSKFREMFSFSGWSLVGNMGYSVRDQTGNIFINLFYNTSVNAARGIGVQVGQIINTFATNFTMAIMPQITKTFASSDLERSRLLVLKGSRLSFILLSIVSIPILLNLESILTLWLGIVPKYTAEFVALSVYLGLIYSLSSCVTIAIQATGKIKVFQIGICLLLLSELPISYFFLKIGYPPYSIMYPSIISYVLALIYRFLLLKKYVKGFRFSVYLLNVIIRCTALFVVSYFIGKLITKEFQDNLFGTFSSISVLFILVCCISYIIGLENNERALVNDKLKRIFKSYEIS